MKTKKGYFWLIGLLLLLNGTAFAEDDAPAVENTPQEEAASSAAPAVVKGEGKKISLELKNVDIIEVLKLLAQKGNLNIVAGKEVRGRVTLFLEDVEIWDALRIIFESNELAYIRDGDIIKVITDREYEQNYGEKFHDKRAVQFFRLNHAKVADVANAVNQLKSRVGKVVADERTNTLIVIDVPQTLSLIKGAMKNLDVAVTTRVFPLRFATPATIEEAAKSILSKNGTIQTNGQSNKVIVTDIEENVDKIAEVVREYDISPYTITKIFPLKYAKFDEIESKLKEELTKDIGVIRADERTNTVIITDLPSKVANMEKVIKAYDEKTREVLIEAKVVQVTLSDAFSLGINWELVLENFRNSGINYSLVNATSQIIGAPAAPKNSVISNGVIFPAAATSGTSTSGTSTSGTSTSGTSTSTTSTVATSTTGSLFSTPGTIPFNLINVQAPFTFPRVNQGGTVVATGDIFGHQNFSAAINALKTIGKVNLLSSPRVTAISGEEAKLAVATRQAFVTNTVVQNNTVATTAENVTFIDVGVILSVTPKINPDYYVTMKIRPEVSAVTSTLTTSSGNVIPIVSTQEAESTVLVRDGVTVILGGLITDSRTRIDNRIPVLGSLPLLGPIFRNTIHKIAKDEIVIFLTPHILSGDTTYEGSWVPSQGIQSYVDEEEDSRHKEDAVIKPNEEKNKKRKKKEDKESKQLKETKKIRQHPDNDTIVIRNSEEKPVQVKNEKLVPLAPKIIPPSPLLPMVSSEDYAPKKEDLSKLLPEPALPPIAQEEAPLKTAAKKEGKMVSFYSF